MKFSEYKYERPDLTQVQKQYKEYVNAIENCESLEAYLNLFEEINQLRNHISTMQTLASIRYSINTADEFYSAENDYWDENMPYYSQCDNEFYKALLASPYRKEAEGKIPTVFFQIVENGMKCFDDCIMEDLQQENKLASEYQKLLASADIEFEGKHYNLQSLKALTVSRDREMRQKASEARYSYFVEHEAEIDRIYDELVKVRTKMAHKLGFKNFTEMGYVRMNRLDYDADMVANYRKQVLTDVVPVASELYERQKTRLGYDQLHYYDVNFEFESGNATPKGEEAELVKKAQKMYHELSKETGEFFDFMVEHELLDLSSKPAKAGGGYCTYIPDYESPFIFSNFNGTSGDVDVLTHEAGHAFQVYSSRHIQIPELAFPTYESCEIHSMSMEFITWPWSHEFFQEDTDKYHFEHLGSAVKFIPYGILVDHYQHVVYDHPEMTPAERKQAWRELEKQYCPHLDYSDCDFLERGNYWFQQGHIFASPFYYVDYTLAQACSLQFWKRSQEKDPEMWNDYLHLCKLGGTKSFLALLEEAHLTSPFEDGSLNGLMKAVQGYLNTVDDTKL